MRSCKRILAALLVLAVLIGLLPAYAAEAEEPTGEQTLLTELTEESEPEPEQTEATELPEELPEEIPGEPTQEPSGEPSEEPSGELPEAEVIEEVTEAAALAEPETEPTEEPTGEEPTGEEPTGEDPTEPPTDEIPTIEVLIPKLDIPDSRKKNLTLTYDDRYSFAQKYPDYVILQIENKSVYSYQVKNGVKSDTKDTAVLKKTSGTDIRCTGTGVAVVTLVPKELLAESKRALSAKETPTQECAVINEELIPAWQVTVTVKRARLSLFFLAGQSNMEGLTNGSGREISAKNSVACTPGTVYSTYVPATDRVSNVTGGTGIQPLTCANNWSSALKSYLPASLTASKSLSGKALAYPLDALTSDGGGKTGLDAALGYEWNRLKGEKVWLINAAWSGSSIRRWQPGEDCYERAKAAYQWAVKVMQAECDAGHYTNTKRRYLFWLQGETDRLMDTENYTSAFLNLRSALKSACGVNCYAIISVRAADSAAGYQGTSDLRLTGPRISQYAMASSTSLDNVYMVSNVNESWVSDSGVKKYFASAYPSGRLTYPLRQGVSTALPATQDAAHPRIHFTQQAHNENGLTAARGLYEIIEGTARVQSVQWRGKSGNLVQRMVVAGGKTATVLPVVTPVTASKQVSYSVSSSQISYQTMVAGLSSRSGACATLTARAGSKSLSTLSVTGCATPSNLKVTNGKNCAKVSWSAVTNAKKYRVFYKTGSGSWVKAGDTTSTSLKIRGLRSGVTYRFTVRCISADARRFTSDYDRTGVTLTYYDAPVLRTARVNGSTVSLTWNRVNAAVGYRIYARRPSGNWSAVGSTTGTSFKATDMAKGTWIFTVRCLNTDKKTVVGWYDSDGTKVRIQ